MKVFCYVCEKEVKPRCQLCGHDRTPKNDPQGLCELCHSRMICPTCGTRRFRT